MNVRKGGWRYQGKVVQVSWLSVERREQGSEEVAYTRVSFMDMETWGGSFIICPLAKTDLEWDIGQRVEVLDEHGVI